MRQELQWSFVTMRDWTISSRVENGWRGEGEELRDFGAVADCWAIATTVDGEGKSGSGIMRMGDTG